MPYTIDEEKFRKQTSFDVSAPPNSPTGIPVKQIAVEEFPRVVYKHPKEPFKTIIHRNAKHEVVDEEIVPSEHLTMKVENKKELDAALKSGWELKPFVPAPPPSPDANLYGEAGK